MMNPLKKIYLHNTYIFYLVSISLILLLCIAVDLSPFLRGPEVYPPEWRWPYLISFSPTKIWMPVLISMLLLLFTFQIEKKFKPTKRYIVVSLFVLIALGFLFQMSVLYYSRAGIPVLIHRIINPDLSGYFTASLSQSSVSNFLRTFDQNVGSYPMYARFHPPFSILFFSAITTLAHYLTPLFSSLIHTTPSHADVAQIWRQLTADQRTSAVLSGIVISILSQLTIIPIFLSTKLLFNTKIALRTTVLFCLIPSVVLFVPLNDILSPLFMSVSFYFFILAMSSKKYFFFLLSGITLVTGMLFTLTFLPTLFYLFVLGALFIYQQKIWKVSIRKSILFWIIGLCCLPFILYVFFQYNFILSSLQLFHYHSLVEYHKRYLMGLIYAPYDFFLFLGLPISIIILSGLGSMLHSLRTTGRKSLKKLSAVTVAFWIFLIATTFSGSVRVESARIWMPFIPLALLAFSAELQQRKISSKQYLILVVMMILQVLLFQTVLVTVW